jgi:predicted NAD/FAD-binding protein
LSHAGRQKAAVVGSGIAGLTAAYVLQERYDVTLYESEGRLGGHTDTHDVITPDAGTVPIDSGFIVHNQRTYPLLCRLFSELHVVTRQTEMSMSVHCEGCGLEYAGAKGLGGVFAQPRSLAKPAFLRLLAQIHRFHRQARIALARGDDQLSLGEFLEHGDYSDYFVAHFVVPMVSCVWSVAPGVALRFPARYLFTFLENHGMLSFAGSPTWRTVVGGSRTYVDRLVKHLSAVATSTPVTAVMKQDDGVEIRTADDEAVFFERVVVATHADTALSLLARPTHREQSLLEAFRYSRNDAWLHTDATLLPKADRAQASWNFLLPECSGPIDHAFVSYDMNRLQDVHSAQPHVVTLNATDRIDPDHVLARMTYEHPIYTGSSVEAQRHLSELNGTNLAFAGAYHGWGFHEDGCRSGVAAAASLGVRW